MTVLNHERDKQVNTNVIEKTRLITFVITIAERLKLAREKAGLNQEELAKRAGVSQGTIANIENSIRKQPRQLLSIARVLNVNPEWLQSGKGKAEVIAHSGTHHVSEQVNEEWTVHTSKVKQALGVLETALTQLDLQGRERVAPLFESFARSPGSIIKQDIAMLLETTTHNKSGNVTETNIQKTG
jgi:transcriptional regulator with XRE-family HTH domain